MAGKDAVIRLGIEVGEVKKGLDTVQKELKQTATAAKKMESGFSKELKQARKEIDKLKRSSKGIKSSFGGMKAGLLGAAAGFISVGAAVRGLDSAFQVTAKVEGLRQGLVNLAGDSERAEAALNAVMRATNGTVSEMEAMKIANKAMSFGIVENAGQLEELATIGVTLGRSLGISASKSVEDLTTALARQSPMILDNLGITLKLEDAYKIYAKSLGKSAKQLTEAEKQQAFMNAALIKGREKVEAMGGKITTTADAYLGFKARLADAGVQLAESVTSNEALGKSIENISKYLDDNMDDIATWGGHIVTVIAKTVDFVSPLLKTLTGDFLKFSNRLEGEDLDISRNLLGGKASDLRAEITTLEDGLKTMAEDMRAMGISEEEITHAHGEQTKKLVALNAELEKYKARAKEVRGQTDDMLEGHKNAKDEADALAKSFGKGGTGGKGGDDLTGSTEAVRSAFQKLGDDIERFVELAPDVQSLTGDLTEQAAMLDAMAKGAESAKDSLFGLWVEGKIDAEAYRDELANILEAEAAIAQQRAEVREERLASVAEFLNQDAETKQAEGGSFGGVGGELGSTPFSDAQGEAELEGAGFDIATASMDPEFDLDAALERWDTVQMAMRDGTLEMTEAQNQLKEAGLGVNDAINTQLKSLQKQGKAAQDVAALHNMFGQAASQAGGMLIDMAIKGEFSAKKLLKATLDSISKQSKQKAMFELGAGFAALAKKDGAGAALHFKSAAVFGALAIASGIAGNAVGVGEGEGGGQSESSSGPSGQDRDIAATQEAVAEGDTVGPNVSVIFDGAQFLGEPSAESLALITSAVEKATSNAAGGNSLRGG